MYVAPLLKNRTFFCKALSPAVNAAAFIAGSEFGIKVVGGRMCTGGFNGVYVAKVTGGSTTEKCIKEGKPSMIISPICRIWVSVKSGTGQEHPGTFPEHPHNTPKTPRHPRLRFLNFHTFSCLSFLRPRQHGSGQSFERTTTLY